MTLEIKTTIYVHVTCDRCQQRSSRSHELAGHESRHGPLLLPTGWEQVRTGHVRVGDESPKHFCPSCADALIRPVNTPTEDSERAAYYLRLLYECAAFVGATDVPPALIPSAVCDRVADGDKALLDAIARLEQEELTRVDAKGEP